MLLYHNYKVIVAGQDVTSRFDPRLLSISITRASGEASDTCDLNLSDPDGVIVLPTKRDTVLIQIDGQQAFEGFVSDVDYKWGKGDGRTLTVSASSIDQGGKTKEPVLRHKDDATLEEVAKEFGHKAGLEVTVAGSITSIKRSYWSMHRESFMSWAQRVSDEVGASLKIIGSRAFIVGINEGISASGKTLTPIIAQDGVNMIGGNISPIISRPKFKDVEIEYFDVAKGERVKKKVPTGINDVDASLRSVITAADEDQADKRAGAEGKKSDREKGSGSVQILGDVFAEPEAICSVSGVRPGIDGDYRISSVTHTIDKSSGFKTDLSLKQPQGEAGKDTRGSAASEVQNSKQYPVIGIEPVVPGNIA